MAKAEKLKIASVQLSAWDPNWIEIFYKEVEKIKKEIEPLIDRIEHIGSTSIKGMIAKPEIDIMVGVLSLKDVQKCIEPMLQLGYLYFPKFEALVPERRYFRKSDGIIPLFHIHMVETGSEFWKNRILFRDFLRDHPEIAKEYSDLKERLAKKYDGDRGGYSVEKDEFVKGMLAKMSP